MRIKHRAQVVTVNGWLHLKRQNLSRTYLAHHELESVLITDIIVSIVIIIIIIILIVVGWLQAAPEEVSVQREDAALSQLPYVQGELRHHGSE